MVTRQPTLIVRSCRAPSARGGKYRRPVVVRVLAAGVSEWHAVRGLIPEGVLFERANVDSRYDGPRSAYGQAMSEACAVLDAALEQWRARSTNSAVDE